MVSWKPKEDFGLLGSPPAHPQLLDWLACEYRDGGWSLKKLLKQIFLSRVYQQDSAATPAHLENDPRGVWLTRGPRYRLSAEVLRDQTLAAAGLLSLKKGGPPVMPPQPDGLWRSTYNGQKWINAEGEDRFRRALYTYLKRTTPYPSFTTFDSGSGEVCQIRRIRTNTPLQALVSLNDPVNLEAAGALALQMQAAGTDGVQHGLRRRTDSARCTGRTATAHSAAARCGRTAESQSRTRRPRSCRRPVSSFHRVPPPPNWEAGSSPPVPF
ncbi:MAG UNVERIFIED_CONTAM: DUF1553 domain-containing protein [Planctomycetaceae bacterium]